MAPLGTPFGSYIDRVPHLDRKVLSVIHKGLAEGSLAKPAMTLAAMASVPDYLIKLGAREQLGKVVMSADG